MSFRLASRATCLGALLLVLLPGLLPAQVDPPPAFDFHADLTGQALFSCADARVDGNSTVDSLHLAEATAGEEGHLRSDADVVVRGNTTIRGDAVPGPGFEVDRRGRATITGSTDPADEALGCRPIDLDALRSLVDPELGGVNDNDLLPRTDRDRQILDARGRFVLREGDGITLPAGTYEVTDFFVGDVEDFVEEDDDKRGRPGGDEEDGEEDEEEHDGEDGEDDGEEDDGPPEIRLGGQVRILVLGDLKVDSRSQINAPDEDGVRLGAPGSPFDLRLWVMGPEVDVAGRSTVSAHVYAPDAALRIAGTSQVHGSLFADEVRLTGTSHLQRVIDDQPPEITVDSPLDGASVRECVIPVRGTASDGQTGVTLEINGESVEVARDGTFDADVSLFGDDPGLIVLVATDLAGNRTETRLRVEVVPPELQLVSPAPDSLVGERIVELSGTSGTALEVMVNGLPAEVTGVPFGSFSVAGFDLGDEGLTTLEITGTNCAHEVTETFVVDLDTLPPEIAVQSPSEGDFFGAAPIAVSGFVFDAHLASVTVNQVDATVTGESFVAEGVSLVEGPNELVAVATDALGRVTESRISVILDTTAPTVSIDAPATGTILDTPTITVEGTASDEYLHAVQVRSPLGEWEATLDKAAPALAFRAEGVELQEGPNDLVAHAEDVVHNHTDSPSITVVLDTLPPELTIDADPIPGLTAAGTLVVGGTVADPHLDTVTATVTDDAGSTVSSVLATVSGGTWSAEVGLAEGGNSLTVEAVDILDHASTTDPVRVVRDSTPPAITIGEPAPGDGFDVRTITVRGTVSDAHLDAIDVLGVPAEISGDPTLPEGASGGGVFEATVEVPEGDSELRARAVDVLDQSSQATPVPIVVDTLPPELGIDPPAAPLLGDPSLTVTGPVSDPHLDEVLVVNAAGNETPAVVVDGTGDGRYEASVELVEGENVFHAVARDTFGHESTSAEIRVVLDSLDPVVAVDPPTPLLADATIVVTGSVQDAHLESVTVNGIAVTVEGDPVAGTPFSAEIPLHEGANEIVATATDQLGHVGVSAPVVTVRDSTPPSLSLDAPLDGATVTSLAVPVEGSVADAHLESVTVNGVVATVSGGRYEAVVPVTEGLNRIRALAVDALGQSTEREVQVFLDTLPPAVTIDTPSPAAGACLRAEDPVTLGGRFGDPNPASGTGGEPPAVQVEVRRTDGSSASYVGVLSDDGERWSVADVDLGPVDGVAAVTVLATDVIGNSASAGAGFAVDATAPSLSLTLDGQPFPGAAPGTEPAAGTAPTLLSRQITLGATVSDGPSQASPDAVLTLDGAVVAADTPVAAEGTHLATATVTDCAGRQAAVHALFEIDLTGPALLSTTPADGARFDAGIASYSGTSDADLARALVNGKDATVSAGAFSLSPYPWREGENRVEIELFDQAGHRAVYQRTFHVDTAGLELEIVESGLPIAEGAVFLRPVRPEIRVSESETTVTATLDGVSFQSGSEIATSGTYRLEATASDAAGHSASAAVSFRVDLAEGPRVEITSPLDATVHPGPTVRVEGTSERAVSVTVNGLPATLAADGTWSVDGVPLLLAEPTPIVATARDAEDRTHSMRILVLLSAEAPQILILEPADGTVTPLERIDVAGAVAGGAVATGDGLVRVASSAGEVVAEILPDDTFRARDVPLAAGTNEVVARVVDENGVVGEARVTVESDATPPRISMVANGQPLDEGQVFSSPITVTVTVSDESGALEDPLVRLNGEPQAVSTSDDGSGRRSVDLAVGEDGGYLVSVVARDVAENEARAERSFLLDLGGCVLSDVEPAAGTTVSAERVSLIGRSGKAEEVKVRVPQSGSTTDFDALVADGTFLAGDVPLAVGENALEIVCVDAGGGVESVPHPVTRVQDTGGPTIAIDTPADGSTLVGGSITVAGDVSAASVVTVNGLSAQVSGGRFEAQGVALVEGPNVLGVRAVDAEGQVATDRAVVFLDSQAPPITLTAPDNNARVGVAGSGPPAVDVSGIVDVDEEPNLSSVRVTSAAGGVTASVDAGTGRFVALDVPLDPDVPPSEAQAIVATARDALGHESSTTVDVVLDVEGPAITLSAPPDLERYDETVGEVTVAGEAWAAEGAQISLNGAGLEPSFVSWSGAAEDGRLHTEFSVSLPLPGEDGAFGVIARVRDLEDRVAGDRRLLFQDTTPPEVLELIPADGESAVDPNSLLLALFTEPVDHASLAATDGLSLTRLSTGQRVVGGFTVAGNAVALAPGAGLVPGDEYRLRAGVEITDKVGHPLTAPVEHTFRVAVAATSAAPVLDPLPSVVCARELAVAGQAAPNATVKVRDGSLTFTGFSDADGRFEVALPISSNGYHLLHVWTVESSGSASPEATAVVRVDCSAPRVEDATFDRTVGVFRIRFSEAVDPATIDAGGTIGLESDAIRLRDAEDPEAPLETATVTPAEEDVAEVTPTDVSAGAWWRDRPVRLQVGPPTADLEGNAMGQTFETVFFPGTDVGGLAGGFLFGEAYDDATGRPLGAVSARLYDSGAVLPGTSADGSSSAPAAEALTEGRGRFTMAGEIPAGRYALLLERSGWTRSVRRLPLEPSKGAVSFDGRLTPLAEPAGTIEPGAGGRVERAGLALEAAAGALAGADPLEITLTPLSGQGLPDFLPLGWTPAAVADLRVEDAAGPLPDGRAAGFAPGITVDLPMPAWVDPAADELVAAQYELATGVWTYLGRAEVASGSDGPLLRLEPLGPGAIAVAVPDVADPPPVPADRLETLRGVEAPSTTPAFDADLTLDPPVVPPTGRSTARVVARSADGVTPWPSGLAVQAFLEEKLILAGGAGQLLEAPFSADLVLYHPRLSSEESGSAAPDAAGAMEFTVSPSPRAAQVLLDVGFESIRLFPFPEEVERGQVLGPTGGTITSSDGLELTLPEGALSDRITASVELLGDAALAELPALAGYDTLAAVRVDLEGRTLARAATLRLPSPEGTPEAIAGEPRLLLLEERQDAGDFRGSYSSYAATIERQGSGATERLVAPPPVDPPVEGLVHEGVYRVVWARMAVGLATGYVQGAAGEPLGDARVLADGLGSADLARPAGRYAVPVPAGSESPVRALHPSTDETAESSLALGAGQVIHADLRMQPVAPSLVSVQPQDGAVDQPVGTTVAALFSEPLDPASVGRDALRLELAGDDGTGLGVFADGETSLSATGDRIVFTPTRPLVAGRQWIARLEGTPRDLQGTLYDGPLPVEWRFATSTVLVPGGQVDPSKFTIRIPVDGVATITAEAGAVPLQQVGQPPWIVVADVVGSTDPLTVSHEVKTDGSVTFEAGRAEYPVTIEDEVWVKVLDPNGELAAHFPVGPFTSPDGLAFIAPAGEASSFTSAEGVVVDVPAGAFDEAKRVGVRLLPASSYGGPRPRGVRLGAYFEIDFEGEAAETLRVHLPAPDAAATGAQVFFGVEKRMPWGSAVELISHGAVAERPGGRFLSNDPSLQPEPPLSFYDGRKSGAAKNAVAELEKDGSLTCQDKKERGLGRCFTAQMMAEMRRRRTAAAFYEDSVAMSLFAGPMAPVVQAQGRVMEALINQVNDQWVFIPPLVDSKGGFWILPAIVDEPFVMQRRDVATGWVLVEEALDPAGDADGPLVTMDPLAGGPPAPPMLLDAHPFETSRFAAPEAEGELRLRMDLEVAADANERVVLRGVEDFPMPDHSTVQVWDVTPLEPKDGGDPEQPVAVASATVCDDGATWESRPFEGSEEMLMIVTRGDYDVSEVERFDFGFDRALDPSLLERPVDDVVRLVDLGPADGCSATSEGGYPRRLDVVVDLVEGGYRLEVVPAELIPANHRLRLELEPDALRTAGENLRYWSTAPQVFEFATRDRSGDVVGSLDEEHFPFGGVTRARDMIRLGNFLLVGSDVGRLIAVDANDVTDTGRFRPYAIKNSHDTMIRTFATDGHGRLFYAKLFGIVWGIKPMPVETARAAEESECSEDLPDWAQGMKCFDDEQGVVRTSYHGSFGGGLSASEWLSLGSLPRGSPADLQVLTQDETGKSLPLDRFYQTYTGGGSLEDLTPDDEGLYTFDLTFESTWKRGSDGELEPSLRGSGEEPPSAAPEFRKEVCAPEEGYDRYQRVTVDNLSTGQSWSFDVENPWPGDPQASGDGTHRLEGIRARRGDELRVRYNVRTLGYSALVGSGITVTDLNRMYRLQQPASSRVSQCGRRLGQFEGATVTFPPCATIFGQPPTGLQWTSSIAVHSETGCDTGFCRGSDRIDVYSPLIRVGAFQSTGPPTDPGYLEEGGHAMCIDEVGPEGNAEYAGLFDIALANDVEWFERGVRVGLDGSVSPPPDGFVPRKRRGDLVFLSMSDAGVFVFDVSYRRLGPGVLIGHLKVPNQSVTRVQYDEVRGLLFAGGYEQTPDGRKPVIQVWDVRSVNAAPDYDNGAYPQPLFTVNAEWRTNNLAIDRSGTGLIYTWSTEHGVVAAPIDRSRGVFAGTVRAPESEDEVLLPGEKPPTITRIAESFVPLGVPMEPTLELEEEKREENEREATAATKVRFALPGVFGDVLTAKVQSLRALPPNRHLAREDLGAAVAVPGGPGWPETEVTVTLRRIGLGEGETLPPGVDSTGPAGRFGAAYNLYESDETVLLLSDPRARSGYRRQDLPDGQSDAAELADEKAQCRRCDWPAYLPDPESQDPALEKIQELLVGGRWIRTYLAVDPESSPEARENTRKALEFFERQGNNYPAPVGVARIGAPATAVPSPLQASLAEPAQNEATWDPGEAGVSVTLVGGEALLGTTDHRVKGRGLAFSMERTYRSGMLGYGPMGAAGWGLNHFAHLVENEVSGEVQYFDGQGHVWRFYPRLADDDPDTERYEDDEAGSYWAPEGVYLRLQKLEPGGWRLVGRQHDTAIFDEMGRLVQIGDRHVRGADPAKQGNVFEYRYDAFGQLVEIEDDLGREYRFEYHDDPRPEIDGGDGPKYGLLKKVTDWIDREIEYVWSDERTLEKVMLPAVKNPVDAYSQFSYEGQNRPEIQYEYDPQAGVTRDETNTTAVLHGKFAALRLESYTQPDFLGNGATVPRLRFEYEGSTGRVKLASFPDANNVNSSVGGVRWRFDWDNSDAGPAEKMRVRAPWGHELEYSLEKGRATKVQEELEIVRPTGITEILPVERTYTFAEDGRLTSRTQPDGGRIARCYVDGAGADVAGGTFGCPGEDDVDRLARANVAQVVHSATTPDGEGSADYTAVNQGMSYQSDNLPAGITDGLGRPVNLPVATVSSTEQMSFGAEGIGSSYEFDARGRLAGYQGDGARGPSMSYEYGESEDGEKGEGLVERIEHGDGPGSVWTELEYDDAYNIEEERTSQGTTTRTTYDAWDRAVRTVTGLSDGRLRSVGNPECSKGQGAQVESAYDSAGHLVSERYLQDFVDAAGNVECRWVETQYVYNAREQIVRVEQSHRASATTPGSVDGRLLPVEERRYDEFGRLSQQRSRNLVDPDLVTFYRYDEAGRVAGIQVGEAGEQVQAYDENSRVVLQTDGDEGVWRGRFDVWDRLWHEVSPTGAVTVRRFDKAHHPTEETVFDADPLTTPTAEVLSRVQSHFTSFSQADRVVEFLDEDETTGEPVVRVTERIFDDSGRTTEIWSGPPIEGEPGPVLDRERARRETSLQYEIGIGRVLLEAYGGFWGEGPVYAHRKIYDAENRSPWPDQVDSLEAVPGEEPLVLTYSTRYVRDALGRPIREARNDGSLLLTNYDRLGGQAVRLQTGAGTTSAISFDGVGRPVRHIRPNDRGETRYAYDLDGRMLRTQVTTDGTEPWETVYAYDSTGRVVVIDHEDGSSESYTYHPDNTVATKTTRDGILLDLAYDQANRLLAVTPSLGGTRPASLAPLDAGDRFTYDELSRPLSLERGATLGGALDPSLSVSIPAYDLASRPRREDVGSRTPLAWTYDTWSRPVGIALPDLARPAGGFTGYQRDYDTLDRVIDLGAAGGALGTQNAGASWTWGGDRLYSLETKTALKTSVRYGYIAGRGPQRPDETDESSASRWKVGTLTWGGGEDPTTTALTVPAHVWGQFAYGWRGNDGDPRDGTKIGRQAITAMAGGGLDLFAGLGWAWDYDAGVRLSHAVAGRGDVDGRAPPTGDASENRFAYEYGEGDELQRIVREAEGTIAEMEIGAEGRIVARSGVPFAYDAVGRRTEDDRFVYLWNWRSELVQVTVKDIWPGGEEEQSPFAGHQVRYEYDAAGRLTHRIHLGPLPEGATDDGQRPHVESRAFVWEQDGLLAEVAYNDAARTQVRWRKTYVPGASGYDDAVQVAVEVVSFPGSTFAGTNLYTYLRDELGTVIGLVAEDEGSDPANPPIPVRYLYTPYGEAHAEVGPELRLARFDADVTTVETGAGPIHQVEGENAAGALALDFTAPIEGSTLPAGLSLDILTPGGWTSVDPAQIVLGTRRSDPTKIAVLLEEGWERGAAYRLRLDSDLQDTARRALVRPDTLEWSISAQHEVAVAYEERFPIRYESYEAAGTTVGGRFPGGQSCLFHGLWTDPVTGINHARARWYDNRNATFLTEDPLADVDSPNLYAYTGWQPTMGTDPTGLCTLWEIATNKNQCRDYFKEGVDENWEEDKDSVSMAVSFVPVLGDLKDAQEAFSGKDLISGRELTAGERGITAIAMVIPGVGGAALREGMQQGVKAGKEVAEDVAGKAAKEAAQSADEVAGTAARKSARRADNAAFDARRGTGCPINCFTAGTLVLGEYGLVPIEELKIGDRVWAFNEETSELELMEITQLYVRQRDEIYVLTFADGTVVETTSEHPFRAGESSEWLEAQELSIGDTIHTAEGASLEVVRIEIVPGDEWVHNFTVEGLHSYFVGDGRLLVHNCPYASGRTPLKEYDIDYYGKFNTKPRIGDDLEGHEVLQNAVLRNKGLIKKRRGAKMNPALALGKKRHRQVGKLQAARGLNNPARLKNMSISENIEMNAEILRDVGVPEDVVQTIVKEARSYGAELLRNSRMK